MADSAHPADLTVFLRALQLAGERALGIRAEDIALVEAAWSIPDTVVSSHGWVLALEDGRRVHLEYTLDDSRRGAPEELTLTQLRLDETYPAMENDAGVLWYRPEHINRHLGIGGPSLH